MRTYKAANMNKKRRSGKKAQRSGKLAEQELLATDVPYLIYKRYEPYKRLNGGTIFKAQSLEKAGCDYSIFTPHNAGMIEVKSRDSDRLALSALDVKQHEQLAQLSEWGRIALVLARLSGNWYCIPYSIFKEPPRGKKSWNVTELEPYALEQRDGKLLLLAHLDRHYPPPPAPLRQEEDQ